MTPSQGKLFDLTGRIAIITGGAGGIGKAVSLALAEYGAVTVILDIDKNAAEQTAGCIEKRTGIKSRGYRVDVCDRHQVEEVFKTAAREFGSIDILVTSAGINFRESVLDITEEHIDKILQVNLKSVLFCSQAAGRQMIQQGRGKIVNIASVSSLLAHPERGAYAASKGAVVQLTKVTAHEWAKYNIQVNAISPGTVLTSFVSGITQNDQQVQILVDKVPLGRIGVPEDIAGTAIYLCSEASDYVTGINIFVDGGRTLD